VLKVPGVKKTFGIPELPAAPTSSPQSPFSIFPALKQTASAADDQSSLPVESSKRPNKKTSSSAIISQRLRSLEKQVKGRKKNKKID
jgi:YidC/Oxa1 family membrane protein insertase